jgi:hypothetical protein
MGRWWAGTTNNKTTENLSWTLTRAGRGNVMYDKFWNLTFWLRSCWWLLAFVLQMSSVVDWSWGREWNWMWNNLKVYVLTFLGLPKEQREDERRECFFPLRFPFACFTSSLNFSSEFWAWYGIGRRRLCWVLWVWVYTNTTLIQCKKVQCYVTVSVVWVGELSFYSYTIQVQQSRI